MVPSTPRKLLFPLLSILAVLCSIQHTAKADTITFDSLEQPGSSYTVVSSYSELGFTFINLQGSNSKLVSAQQGNSVGYAGSAGIANDSANGFTRVSHGGTGFSLNAIDLSRLSTNFTLPVKVQFTGNYLGGGTTVQVFTFSQFGFQNFAFNSTFSNLAFVDFGPIDGLVFQFDNVVVNAATAVPEPTTMLLLGTGLLGISARARKRRKNKAD